MVEKLTAVIGLLMMAVFVLFLSFKIGALPLIIIAVAVVVMATVDVWQGAFKS